MNAAKISLPSSSCRPYAMPLAISSALVTGGRLVNMAAKYAAVPLPGSPQRRVQRRRTPCHPPVAHFHAFGAQALDLFMPLGRAVRECDPAIGTQHAVPGQRRILV